MEDQQRIESHVDDLMNYIRYAEHEKEDDEKQSVLLFLLSSLKTILLPSVDTNCDFPSHFCPLPYSRFDVAAQILRTFCYGKSAAAGYP